MALLRRISRFLKADLHGLLDGLEEPEEVVKQTIRDMEEALGHHTQTLNSLRNRVQRLRADTQEVERLRHEINQQIDLCFAADNPVLARNFIRKRLVCEQQSKQLQRAMAEAQAQCEALERSIAEQQQQLAAVVQQLALYTTARPHDPTTPGSYTAGPGALGISEDDVEVAFLEEQRRRGGRSQTTA